MNKTFLEEIEKSSKIAVLGHTRPDGDCVGSCLAIYQYIKDNYKEKLVDVYLESVKEEFQFLSGANQVKTTVEQQITYDLFISCDCGDIDRFEQFQSLYETAGMSICVDHHISNDGFGALRYIEPTASSTCEILYGLFDDTKISLETATALYMGIVHDTGVFKHTNTTKRTMCIAGELIEKGINTSHIIDDTFYKKTYVQSQILGRALLESIQIMDGKGIFSYISKKTLDFYGADGGDMDGIIDQMRTIEGVEAAILIYETQENLLKVSMRSNDIVDVSKIAKAFGGGGHVKAAGFTISGSVYDAVNNITPYIEHQLKADGTID